MEKVNGVEVDPNYQKYLTEKLDNGEPNVVVDSVVRLITNSSLSQFKNFRIADFGCFTGSILNRIHLSLPESLREKIGLFGFDYDSTIIKKAKLMRPQISFRQYNLIETFPKTDPFQVGIFSNVLHEVYSLKTDNENEAKGLVINSIKNIRSAIDSEGFLIILDGILPNNHEKEVDINFLEDNLYLRFNKFIRSGYCINIPYHEIDDRTVRVTLGGLSTFLVKNRYLETTFWEQESNQIYNYFTKDDFEEVLSFCGFEITKQDFFEIPNINKELKITNPNIQMPFKNTLIIARRV